MCKAIGVDAFKLAIAKVDQGIESLEDLTVNQARKVMKVVNEYRQDPDEIPENIKLA